MSEKQMFRGKRVLVTGGSGFIASHLCRRLLALGARLYVLVKYDSLVDNVRLTGLWNRITPVEADLRNLDSLRALSRVKPHIVYHFAAYNHVGDSFVHVSEAMDSNAKGTANLMESWNGYERFIYISSSEVYGHQERVPFREDATPFPISPYAVGKYAGEMYARMCGHVHKKPVVILRPFNAFGPYQSPRAIVAEIILKCLRGEDLVTTRGIQTRDFNFVENLADGFVKAAVSKKAVGQTINLGSGSEIRIRDLVRLIHRMTGSSSKLRIGELPYRPTEIWRMKADRSIAGRVLGWKPQVDLEQGLSQTIAWYRRFLEVYAAKGSLAQL